MVYKHYKIKKRKKYFKYMPYVFYKYQRLLIGSLTWRGRKLWAYNFFMKLKNQLKLKENIEFHLIFICSLLKITPSIMLYPLKIGGAKQGVPLFISWRKKMTFALKWIILSLKQKYKIVKLENMADEFVNLIYNKGISLSKKRRTYREGFSNRFLLKRFKYRG